MPLLTRDVTKELRLQQVLSTTPQTTVFRALDPQSNDIVALKLISPSQGTVSEEGRQRFSETMEVLRSLRSQSCPDLLDVGFTPEGGAYMVMELMDGAGLETYTGLPPARTIPLLVRVLGALEVLAAEQVFHSNLKPENVLVTRGKDGEPIRLLGLGTAALLAREEGRAVAGRSREDEPFAAPELFEPGMGVPGEGWRADLYSFALLACHVLGAEISGQETDAPAVILAPRHGLGETSQLTGALSIALQHDPALRELSYGELRTVFGFAMPPEPPGRYERTGRIDTSAAFSGEGADLDTIMPTIRLFQTDAPEAVADEPVELTELEQLEIAGEAEPVEDGSDLELPVDMTGDEEQYSGLDIWADQAPAQSPFTDSPHPPPGPPSEVQPVPPTIRLDPKASPASASEPEPALEMVLAGETEPASETEDGEDGDCSSGRSRLRVGALIGAVLLVALAVVLVLALREPEPAEEEAPPPAPTVMPTTPAPTTPTPATPAPPATPIPAPSGATHHLETARTLLAEGDILGAKLALDLITPAQRTQLAAGEQALLNELSAAVTAAETRQSATALRAALRHGSPVRIKKALAALAEKDEKTTTVTPGLGDDLALAREILQLDQQLRAASRRGEHDRVLELATRLIALDPKYSRPYNLREDAAAALERRASAARQAGDEAAAQAHLEPIRRHWPERLREIP